jgi:ribosome-associated protein
VTGSGDLVVAAARAAASKQAQDVAVLDVRDLIVITDYFLIASGASDRQVRTIAEEIERSVRDKGLRPVRREGEREGHWVLLDFVDFVAHVFLDEDREFYDLERLWSDAPRVEWNERAARTGG